jgi:23S rRNA pseudouridine2605 synthase
MVAERLHKVLANSGVASRRACEQLIAAGQVTVDGKIVTEMGYKVDPPRTRSCSAASASSRRGRSR